MKVKYLTCVLLLALAVLLIPLTLAACSDSDIPGPATSTPTPTTAVSPSPSPAQPSGPDIRITSPTNSDKIATGSVTIVVRVTDFSLANKIGQPNEAGQGHIIYYMGVNPPTTPGQPAVTASGTFAASSSPSHVWTNVGSGEHDFSVQLVNNDRTPLDPPVIASMSVRVSAQTGMPAVVILSPREGTTINEDNITISAEVANFNLVDKIGQPNAPNEGHLIFYRDVEAPTIQGPKATTAPGTYAATIDTSYTWQNLTPGIHRFSVQLVNNDNTPLNPPVSARVTITVQKTEGQ